MAHWDGLNRRRFPRINFPCLVVLQGKDPQSKETILCHTENVGVGGLCIILKQHAKLFSEADVQLDLMDMKEHIKCRGKVVWNVRRKQNDPDKPLYYDLGIEFIDIKQEDRNRIEAAIVKAGKNKKENTRAS